MYKAVARALSLVGYCQLLAEMAGKKYRGETGRWRVVIALESIKYVLLSSSFPDRWEKG
jgi:peroxin-16